MGARCVLHAIKWCVCVFVCLCGCMYVGVCVFVCVCVCVCMTMKMGSVMQLRTSLKTRILLLSCLLTGSNDDPPLLLVCSDNGYQYLTDLAEATVADLVQYCHMKPGHASRLVSSVKKARPHISTAPTPNAAAGASEDEVVWTWTTAAVEVKEFELFAKKLRDQGTSKGAGMVAFIKTKRKRYTKNQLVRWQKWLKAVLAKGLFCFVAWINPGMCTWLMNVIGAKVEVAKDGIHTFPLTQGGCNTYCKM
jgi:hypothetical protein